MKNLNYQRDYSPYQPQLPFNFNISYEFDIPKDDISRTVKEVIEGINVTEYIDFSNRNRYGYDGVKMLEAVFLAFTLDGYKSYRRLEELCKFDIRFKFIMNGYQPSFMSFYRFVNEDLKLPLDQIFYDINKYIEEHDKEIDVKILYIDGTKFEANANKFTFVWRKASAKYRERIWVKMNKALYELNKYLEENNIPVRFSVLKAPDMNYAITVCRELEKILEGQKIEIVSGKGCRKHKLQKYLEEFKEIRDRLIKYTKQFDLFGDRNSYSKTDKDATFMHMKYDYYCNTGVFKPGYNVQVGVSSGYIRHVYISSDCNDLPTYIPFMKGYHEAYGCYPEKTPADAGYGSYDNYQFCKENGIELFMKYNTQAVESKRTTDRNRFKSYKFEKNENGEIICPEGHAFTLEKTTIDKRGIYEKENKIYRNEHCDGCPLRERCTKSKNGRTVIVNEVLDGFHKEVRENMSSEEGRATMIQRSIQAEGTFGQIKQDNQYDRLRRRGADRVKLEILLVAIGHNLRKYHTRKISQAREEKQRQMETETNTSKMA